MGLFLAPLGPEKKNTSKNIEAFRIARTKQPESLEFGVCPSCYERYACSMVILKRYTLLQRRFFLWLCMG